MIRKGGGPTYVGEPLTVPLRARRLGHHLGAHVGRIWATRLR